MADYISREAALACFSDWIDRYGHEHTADEMVEYQKIEDLPVADVVEVVRCIDCIHYDDRWKRCFYWGKVSDIHVIERGYCWRAERRADNG